MAVYFVRAPQSGLVKIGHAMNPQSRFAGLRSPLGDVGARPPGRPSLRFGNPRSSSTPLRPRCERRRGCRRAGAAFPHARGPGSFLFGMRPTRGERS